MNINADEWNARYPVGTRAERVPVEQWTMLRLIRPPEPNPHPMPDDMDEWVASFVAATEGTAR
ncbi:hypothetical protein ACFYM3_16215 [Streptomyces massasporeus]|uniref:Uncharacterized protein n=1 Tax=Streptomyces massasporeus TaxID=67324 RepID=A0ABW6LCK5_9ACTN